MDKFIYIKLGRGNCLAEYWLNPRGERNLYKEEYKHAAAIYFGTIRAERIRELSKLPEKEARELFKKETPDKNRDFKAAKSFIEAEKDPTTKFVTISNGRVYFYKPIGTISNMPEKDWGTYNNSLDLLISDKNKRVDKEKKEKIKKAKVFDENNNPQNIPKIMPIEIIKQGDIAKIPHVLASLPCNRYITQGTCREIDPKKNWGAIQAIEYVLSGKKIEVPEAKLVELLSSYELETLVFLILTNADLFVPAWRGGTQKGFDLIAHNFTNSTIQIPSITFESKDNAKSSFTFQVKKGKVKKHSEFADFTIATEYDGDDNRILNANWLLENIRKQSDTREWFRHLLYWISDINSKIDKINC